MFTSSKLCVYSTPSSFPSAFYPQFILHFCDLDFFKLYIAGRMSELVYEGENVKKDTSNTLVCKDAIRKMTEIHELGDIETFAKHAYVNSNICR